MQGKPTRLRTKLNVYCGECGEPMVLRDSMFGHFWGCAQFPACKGTHGAHADGTPLGIPGNRATNEARKRAHAVFDPLWRGGVVTSLMTRKDAYRWLRHTMGMSNKQGHIARFTVEQCDVLIDAVHKCRKEQEGGP